MNKLHIILFFAVALLSCSKNNDSPTPEPLQSALVITKADYDTNYKVGGASYTFFQTPIAGITVPVSGANQTWNFSTLTETSSFPNGGAINLTPSSTAFSSATYATLGSTAWTVSGINSQPFAANFYYELNNNGIYDLGYSQNAASSIAIPSLGATIDFPIQNLNYTGTAKYPSVLFPAKFGNAAVTTNNIVSTSNYNVTASALGLNNTPAQTVLNTSVIQEVVGSGTVNLKGIGSKRVLVIKNSFSDKSNYFIGGAPAPAALLSNLNIVDCSIVTGATYRFVAEGLGTVGIIDVDNTGTITSAIFRKG